MELIHKTLFKVPPTLTCPFVINHIFPTETDNITQHTWPMEIIKSLFNTLTHYNLDLKLSLCGFFFLYVLHIREVKQLSPGQNLHN